MITVVLAAGYATRLYPLTKNFPKPLLEIGGNTILGRMLDDLDTVPDITEHIIVTNHKFAPVFQEWADRREGTKPVTIIDDGTSTNDTRLGAVCDLLLVLEKSSLGKSSLGKSSPQKSSGPIFWWWLLTTCYSSLFKNLWILRRPRVRVVLCVMNNHRSRNSNVRASWNSMRICVCWGWRRNLRCRRAIGRCHRSISI